MVEMHFHFAETFTAKGAQCVQVPRLIFILRKEESVARRATVAITKVAEQARVILEPAPDSFIRNSRACLAPLRLIMVGNAEKHVDRLGATRRPPLAPLARIGKKPGVEASVAKR